MDDLTMVDVELQLQVRPCKPAHQRRGDIEIVQEIARHVARIDRLQQDINVQVHGAIAGMEHRALERGERRGILRRRNAGHQMQATDAGGARIDQRSVDRCLEFIPALRQRGKATFAVVPVARRAIEQCLGQTVAREPFGDGVGRKRIREQELHRGEAGVGGGPEPVEEVPLVEHHGEVGGEARHRMCPSGLARVVRI